MCSIHTFSLIKGVLPDIQDHNNTFLTKFPDTLSLRKIAAGISTDYILLYIGMTPCKILPYAIERMLQIAQMSKAVLLYADYYKIRQGQATPHPTIDYQLGSLRDDFDFGPLLLYKTTAFCQAVQQMTDNYRYAALYDLRLKISRLGEIIHLPEMLYTIEETDLRPSGDKQFDYVHPANREVQIEMEHACTSHLKAINAWLPPQFKPVNFENRCFPVEATVVIPVKNRAKTIRDAVESALRQSTDFSYNIIVVDNHSTDGTSEILQSLAQSHPSIYHHIPHTLNQGIGGCWTEAIQHPQCGKFALQLDSDDLYNSDQVIQNIVETFYKENCAMVIGSYQMVNSRLEEIPPGIIAHREWTPDNGRNNALRINGLGAPRAFYTPILRQIKFPNVSYGEDYAVGLALSRDYRIGRIYTPLYLCRRWEENSDASLDINKLNSYNLYKDKIRTFEILCRITKMKHKK